MAAIITCNSIAQTISQLAYRNDKSLKYRLVHTIKQYYPDEDAVRNLKAIAAGDLIRALWDTGDDPGRIRKKARNLISIRSAVNSDLQKLYHAGGNPDGLTISTDNIFEMSDEAKDKALKAFIENIPGKGPASLNDIAKVLNIVDEMLSDSETLHALESPERLQKLADMKALIQSLSGRVGLGSLSQDTSGKGSDDPTQGLEGASHENSGTGGMASGLEGPGDGQVEGPSASGTSEEPSEEPGPADAAGADDLPDAAEPADEEPDTLVDFDDDIEELEVIDDLPDGDDGPGAGTSGAGDGTDGTGEEFWTTDAAPGEGGTGNGSMAAGLQGPGDGDAADAADAGTGAGPLNEPGPADAAGAGDLPDAAEIADEETGEIEVLDDDNIEELELIDDLPDSEDGSGAEMSGAGDGNAGTAAEDRAASWLDSAEPPDDTGTDFLDDTGFPETDLDRARLLAEDFNRSLAAIDKYFNQYLLIPAGRYPIGLNPPAKDGRAARSPDLGAFYIGKFPVTNALFEVFVERTGYRTTAEKQEGGLVYTGRYQKGVDPRTGQASMACRAALVSKPVDGACWHRPLGPGSTIHNKKNHPVVQVSLEDALAFAAWTGKRLPTEDEWEAAVRTRAGWRFPWGNDWQSDACNIEESGHGDTTPVDAYLDFGNDVGIVDALGNVFEWTSTIDDRVCETDPLVYYIVKSGSWATNRHFGLWARSQLPPESPSNILGFRCVAV